MFLFFFLRRKVVCSLSYTVHSSLQEIHAGFVHFAELLNGYMDLVQTSKFQRPRPRRSVELWRTEDETEEMYDVWDVRV